MPCALAVPLTFVHHPSGPPCALKCTIVRIRAQKPTKQARCRSVQNEPRTIQQAPICNHAAIARLYHVWGCLETLLGITGGQYGMAWLLLSPDGTTVTPKKGCLGVQYTVRAKEAL